MSVFNGFGTFSRPDIGLISDGSQNLAEIFDSDKRDALSNILIPQETLDKIYGLSEIITREDLRSTSGLNRFLLPSLNQINEVFNNRIETILNSDRVYYGPELPLGGIGSPSLNQPNIVLFNGSIQCEGVQYRVNTIGSSLFSDPVSQTVSLSTSRSSLFNSVADTDNPGYFKSVKYPGSIRVRRRSHVNRIIVPRSTFITKSAIAENPSHTIKVSVDNGNTGTSVPVKLLSTKNTPLRVYCRMFSGQVKFTFTDSLAPYFFGYQIQPVQQRPYTTPVEFLPVEQKFQASGSLTYTLDIDISNTGYQNLYDLYLYLYVNPEKVSSIEFSGINIKETPDRKDLGLIGFNNLTRFKVSGGSMTILPLWLKTLSDKLTTIDLSESGDTWRSGPMGWFDIRNPSATPSFSHPLYTVVSYLTIPRTGPIINEEGNAWSDVLFEKYIENQSRVAGTDYRQFTKITSLRLGDRFLGDSPRFDDVFPNLTELSWRRTETGKTYRYLFGSLPRMAKTESLMSYDISGSLASGDINQIGTSSSPLNSNHVSKYKFTLFSISGCVDTTGYIGNPSEDWSAWHENTISLGYNYTSASSHIQGEGIWTSLTSLSCSYSGGINFTTPSTPLSTPRLTNLSISQTSSTGQLPSLGTSVDELLSIQFGGCGTLSTITTSGINYLLPTDFAPLRSEDQDYKLTAFSIDESPLTARLRKNDLAHLYSLTSVSFTKSSLTGRLPDIPLKRNPEIETKSISVSVFNSNFHDLSSLNINDNNQLFSRDIDTITAYSQNISGGGCKLPSFEGTSLSRVRIVDVSNSLPSTYGPTWSVTDLRGSCVSNSHTPTTLSGLSISRTIQSALGGVWTESDNVYIITGSSVFQQYVMVNDSISTSVNGSSLARVLSVSNTSVVIDQDIPDSLFNSTLYFTRNTVDLSDWFMFGFTSIEEFRMAGCRLSGTLNIRSGFSRVVDGTSIALDLSNNLISEYTFGSLGRVFSGSSRKITVDLSRNNLPLESIRSIISECFTLDGRNRFTNCIVRIGFNKLDTSERYINYSQSEIFPTITQAGQPVVTALRRNETFKVYNTITTVDGNGVPTTTQVQVGTKTVSIPGALIGETYYKFLTNNTQVIFENSLAIQFKSLKGIQVDLGFNYISPNTSPTVVSTEYSDETTRYQSIIDAGYNPSDLVNP